MVRLEQKFLLQQKLSPQHVLFSTLLQMPVLALEQRIKAELELNPLLEEEIEIQEEQEEDEKLSEEDSEQEEDEIPEEENEIEWEDILNDEDTFEPKAPASRDQDEYSRPEVARMTLTDHLISQLHFNDIEEEEQAIGEYIIWNIDEDGYLSCSVEHIAESFNISTEEVEKVLKIIQTFDPPGIASRNLQECLLNQLLLKEDGLDYNLAVEIIRDHFDDFKNKRFEKLSRNTESSMEEIKEAMKIISKLNPKPGEGYIEVSSNYVIPDLIVEKMGNDFIISLNESNIPQLKISNSYKDMLLNGKNTPEEARKYIRQKLESARWLINSIQQRKVTMLKVMREILKKQREFFEKGTAYLKPMILKDIADEINMDISTISRVTNGKYVQTDYGVFELKYFFSEKMTTRDGEEVSTYSIKNRIKEIIAEEDSKKPLNDGEIAKILSDEGIPIARRTVAKYREQMMIPVSRLRRKI